MMECAIRLGEATDDKQWPLLIPLKDESKKQEIFQNLNIIRESEAPFNKINIAHGLTKMQTEQLQERIKKNMKGSRMTSQGNGCIMYEVHYGIGM